MVHFDRLELCKKISRHVDSTKDLLQHWSKNDDISGVEWFVGRLLFSSCPSLLQNDIHFRECVSSIRDSLKIDSSGLEKRSPYPSENYFVQTPTRYGSSVYRIAQRTIKARCTVVLRKYGFLEMIRGNTRYWKKQSTSGKVKPTIVFIHGLGIGLYPYVSFINHLSDTFNVIAVEFDHLTLSGELTSNIQAADIVCNIVNTIEEPLIFLGHSYGSAIASAIYKRNPDIVSGLVLMAPICFLMYRGEIQSRFFDPRAPLSQKLMSKNPTILSAILDGTVWQASELWSEEVKDTRFLVVLSTDDQLVPFHRTKKHIEDHYNLVSGERELLCVEGKHGSSFLSKRDDVVTNIISMFGSGREN